MVVIAIGLVLVLTADVLAESIAPVGQSVTLTCDTKVYDGVPHYLEWLRGHKVVYSRFHERQPFVHSSFRGRVKIEEPSDLVIHPLRAGDGGNYTCRMHYIDGQSYVYEQSTVLTVLEAPSFIYSPPAYMTGEAGDLITLSCRASGTPTPTLTWYKDGIRLKSSNKINIYGDVLEISDLSNEDVGRYKCKFTNPYGHTTYTTTLTLKGGALITERPRNLTVNKGEPVYFRCKGTASPDNITYTWFKDGKNVKNIRTLSNKVSVEADGSLYISSVGAGDAGVYRCTVSNGLGAPMSEEAHLSVIFTAMVDKDRMQSNIYIPIGRDGRLPCPVKGFPPVTKVVWSKTRGSFDISSPRYELVKEQDTLFTLIIKNVTNADTGWYTCTPHNQNGQGVQSDLMTVIALEPPYFTATPEPVYTIKIDSSISIPCSAQSERVDQPTIIWKKVNGALPESLEKRPRGHITIHNIQKQDGGIYECEATDGEISSFARTELIIENTTPLAPTNVTAWFGHYDIKLSWSPGFDGGYTQTYVILFRETGKANGNWQHLPSYGQRTDYMIPGLTPDTEYELKVLSRNKLGDGMYSASVIGKTLGYTPGVPHSLPVDASGQIVFPSIVKPLGPEPATPDNLTVRHDQNGGINISWEKPLESDVPILYYRVEYKYGNGTIWNKDKPVLANKTSTRFVPKKTPDNKIVKYIFRVRAYGLLAYSDYSNGAIIYYPEEKVPAGLGLGAKIGIGVASFFFVGLLIVVVVILCDLKPFKNRHKSNNDKNGQTHYSIAPQTPIGTSEWQSFYPYHGGRFAVNGEADNVYVVDSHKDTVRTNSSNGRDGSMVRHEQGWYFPRDGHPEQDLTRTYESSSSDKPPPHGISYTANYSNYNGLLHGYYDARTGTQISQNVVNYPHSGIEASDTTDGNMSHDIPNRHYIRPVPADRVTPIPRARLSQQRNESHPIYANQAILKHNIDSSWFAPHFRPSNGFNAHSSTMSPISLSYDREQEIVLKPSLPRQSSMKPSIQVPADNGDVLFDANLSVVKESSVSTTVDQPDYDFRNTSEYPYTNGWVESQTPAFISRQSLPTHSNTFRSRIPEPPTRLQGYHTLAPNGAARLPSYQHQIGARRPMDRGSSISSSVNEMRAHYSRDKLVGTIERIRSSGSRSRKPGSFGSLSSGQSSPQPNAYVNSPLPPPYRLTECYPELVSPVYYNNNNNRQSDANSPRRGNLQAPVNQSSLNITPQYENSGLLTSTRYRAPEFSQYGNKPALSASVPNGLGSARSQSRGDLSQRRSRPSWSRSSAPTPYEYDISCESSPAVVLPKFTSSSIRYPGLYTKPRYSSSHTSQPSTSYQTSKMSYDPSFLLNRYNQQQYRPSPPTPPYPSKLPNWAPSDSVDENYEFDPILIDSEPQDFFHIHSVGMPEPAETDSLTSQGIRKPSLYAEKRSPLVSDNSQRFYRLRDEYNTFKQQQSSNPQQMTLTRLESDIL